MDKWKAKEIKIMQFGGNKKAHAYYTKHNMFVDGRPDHENPALAKYKMALAKQAIEALGDAPVISKTAPTASMDISEPKKEETKEENDRYFDKAAKPPVAATKVSNNQESSIYSFSNMKQNNQQVNLNAK